MLQLLVEYMHRNKQMHVDVLAKTVEQAWNVVESLKNIPLVIE